MESKRLKMSDTQTFVLQEVIDELVNAEKSLMGPLMKLNYFGRLIKNQELIDYCSEEINGYRAGITSVPEYRRLPIKLKIDLQIGFQTFPNKDLPFSMVPSPWREFMMNTSIKEGIAVIENNVKDEGTKQGGPLLFPVAMEVLPHLQESVRSLYRSYETVSAVGAYLEGNSNKLIQILSTVRDHLLALVMKIGEQFGYNIIIHSFRQNQDANNQIIHNYINSITNTGDGNVVNTGDHASQTANIGEDKTSV